MKYSIIITGYNCEKYANKCIDSVLNQTYKNFEIIVYNDASTDKTMDVLEQYLRRDRVDIKLIHAEKNRGALAGRYKAIHEYATGDVVCFLGLDDSLKPDCLEVLNKYYSDPKVKMTYGSWVTVGGKALMVTTPYEDEVFSNKSFRTSGWRATALNTFKVGLIKKVPIGVLLNQNGNFFDNCTDLAYSFPCLEMCSKEEIGVVTEPVYVYRYNHENTTLARLGRPHKTKVREQLKRIKPL